MTSSDSVIVEHSEWGLTLTIDRAVVMNALNADVLARLHEAVLSAEVDPTVHAVVITGAGTKAFSAGADLKELQGLTVDQAQDSMRVGQRLIRDIERATIPVIAAVNGVALGGGFELVLASTIPVLSTCASLGLPESGLGLIPGYGGTQRLPRAVGTRIAAYLMLTGNRLDADRSFQLGFTPVPPVAPDELLETATGIADSIASQGPRAVRSILGALEAGRDGSLDTGLQLETQLAALAMGGAESDEGIAAFLGRRPASFTDRALNEEGQ